MRSPQTTGRATGILLLAQLIVGLTTPYIILQQLSRPLTFSTEPPSGFRARLAVMLLFVGGALTIAIAVTVWPALRERTYSLALWVLALAIVNFSLQCVENAAYMSLLTFRQNYAQAPAADRGVYDIVGVSVRSAWKWVHYTHLLVMVSWMLVLFVTLGRAALVPRVLAALGVVATLLQMTGITLPQFLSYPSPAAMVMGLTLGAFYLVLSVWLMWKGFRSEDRLASQ